MWHSSDTESHVDVKSGKRNYAIVLTNLFKRKSDKNAGNAQATGEKKDGDEEAARSETTVVIEDDTPKKVSVIVKTQCENAFARVPCTNVELIVCGDVSFQEEKSLVYAELLLKQPTDESDGKTKQIVKETTEYAEIVYADKKSDKKSGEWINGVHMRARKPDFFIIISPHLIFSNRQQKRTQKEEKIWF